MTDDARKQRTRERYSIVAEFLDEIREWDADAKLTYASENGRQLGERGPDGVSVSEIVL